jgi:hypothetical protein
MSDGEKDNQNTSVEAVIDKSRSQKRPKSPFMSRIVYSRVTPIVLTVLLMLFLFGTSALIAYQSQQIKVPPPTNFSQCSKIKSSTIRESYPAVCISKTGQEFIQPVSEEEKKLLESYVEKLKIVDTNKLENECIKSEGEWLENYRECESALTDKGLDQKSCEELNGKFDECASPCRHDPNAELCAAVCVKVCKF